MKKTLKVFLAIVVSVIVAAAAAAFALLDLRLRTGPDAHVRLALEKLILPELGHVVREARR